MAQRRQERVYISSQRLPSRRVPPPTYGYKLMLAYRYLCPDILRGRDPISPKDHIRTEPRFVPSLEADRSLSEGKELDVPNHCMGEIFAI